MTAEDPADVPALLEGPRPNRTVFHADALEWLQAHAAPTNASVVTSLPDVSELPELGFDGWRRWFSEAARRVIEWVPADGLAMFFQSDVRRQGVWVDKSYLVLRALEQTAASLTFHKIVCRKAPGTITHGRASYSHLICISPTARAGVRSPGPDVLADAGFMPSSKSMGVEACRLACRFLLSETATRVVVDPFCGHGTLLAVANALGLDAIGVDRSVRCCRAARKLDISLDRPLSRPNAFDHSA